MSKVMKRRIFAGPICEQIVYRVPERANAQEWDPEKAVRRERFRNQEEYEKFKENISRRRHYLGFMANYGTDAVFSTLTFDDEHELEEFQDAKKIRNNFRRMLQRAYPGAKFRIYMGRGRTTHRIHFHMVCQGIPLECWQENRLQLGEDKPLWKYGSIRRTAYLRKKCRDKRGNDIGQDYKALADYLFDHWRPEVGGHRWFATKNEVQPEKEPAKEVRILGAGYSEKRPPVAPKGYRLSVVEQNEYGFQRFRYVVDNNRRRE